MELQFSISVSPLETASCLYIQYPGQHLAKPRLSAGRQVQPSTDNRESRLEERLKANPEQPISNYYVHTVG